MLENALTKVLGEYIEPLQHVTVKSKTAPEPGIVILKSSESGSKVLVMNRKENDTSKKPLQPAFSFDKVEYAKKTVHTEVGVVPTVAVTPFINRNRSSKFHIGNRSTPKYHNRQSKDDLPLSNPSISRPLIQNTKAAFRQATVAELFNNARIKKRKSERVTSFTPRAITKPPRVIKKFKTIGWVKFNGESALAVAMKGEIFLINVQRIHELNNMDNQVVPEESEIESSLRELIQQENPVCPHGNICLVRI